MSTGPTGLAEPSLSPTKGKNTGALRAPHNRARHIISKINGPRGQKNASASGNADHLRDAEARTARNTAVN
jgi:hypothetical protein